jgi:Astacin (Peptidase family M12A)/Clostridial hydrophobic W
VKQGYLLYVVTGLFGFFVSCGQQSTQVSTVEEGSWVVQTTSRGVEIDKATEEKLIRSKKVIHTFSNGTSIAYENRDWGDAVSPGDIVIARSSEMPKFVISREKNIQNPSGETNNNSTRSVGSNTNSSLRWAGGIPYVIDSSIPGTTTDLNSYQGKLQSSINSWNSKSVGIKFRQKSGNEPYVRFVLESSPSKCYSSVGSTNSSINGSSGFPTSPEKIYLGQTLALGTTCINDGDSDIHHEMGHAMGMWHEQQRCDRDGYVRVVQVGFLGDDVNYGKRCNTIFSNVKDYGKYDYSSIMHYGYFTNNPGTAYETRMEKISPVNSQYEGDPSSVGPSQLSASDIKNMNDMYQLTDPPLNGVQYQSYIKNIGWQNWVPNNAISGTVGQSLPVQAIRISVPTSLRSGIGIKYRVYVQNRGWLDYVQTSGGVSGTLGSNQNTCGCVTNLPFGDVLLMEAIQISLTGNRAGCNISYQAHLQNIGWQGYVSEGSVAGTTGQFRRLEALQINLTCI